MKGIFVIKPRARVINEILRSKRSEKHQDKNSVKRLRKKHNQSKLKEMGNKDD